VVLSKDVKHYADHEDRRWPGRQHEDLRQAVAPSAGVRSSRSRPSRAARSGHGVGHDRKVGHFSWMSCPGADQAGSPGCLSPLAVPTTDRPASRVGEPRFGGSHRLAHTFQRIFAGFPKQPVLVVSRNPSSILTVVVRRRVPVVAHWLTAPRRPALATRDARRLDTVSILRPRSTHMRNSSSPSADHWFSQNLEIRFVPFAEAHRIATPGGVGSSRSAPPPIQRKSR